MLFWYNLFLHNSELINSSSFSMLSNQVLNLSTELLISTITFFACRVVFALLESLLLIVHLH